MLTTQPEPKYRRIAEALRRRVRSGQLPPGARLPSYRELAEEHGVTVMTVRQAMQLLQAEGTISSRPRVGSAVASPKPTWRMIGMLELGRTALAEQFLGRIKEVHDHLQEQRCHLTMRFEDGGDGPERASLEDWIKRLDAVLLDGRVTVRLLRELASLGVPVVMIGEPTDGPCPPEISSVSVDVAGITRLAVSHLSSLGHRRIALYSHHGTRYFDELIREFHRCMAEQGLADGATAWRLTELSHKDASIPKLLDTLKDPPTAIIVEERGRAATIRRVLSEHGWPVPERMSVLAISSSPDEAGLTGVYSPWNELITRAVALADQAVRSAVPTSRSERIAPVFAPGKTCRLLTDSRPI